MVFGTKRTEDRRQRTENREQRTDDGGQKTENREQKIQNKGLMAKVGRLFPALFFLSSVLCLLSSVLSVAAEPFFITIEKVELKNASGEWVDVVEPDRRLDLAAEEPTVSFFNNGRIAPGDYTNVRVTLIDVGADFMPAQRAATTILERKNDYAPPLLIKKGSFVNVSFLFDLGSLPQLNEETIKEVRVTVDDQERLDAGDNIKIWS